MAVLQLKSEHIQAEWLIQQILELDRMIEMHQSGDSAFMADQYASRRLQYFKELIGLLASSAFNSTGRETFPLIHALTKENYAKSAPKSFKSIRKNAFDRTLEFYRKNSNHHVRPAGASRWVSSANSSSKKATSAGSAKSKSSS